MDQKVFKFVFSEAMRDATLELAYEAKDKKWLKNCDKLPQSTEAIQELIRKVLLGEIENQEQYDKFFLEAACTVCKEVNDHPESNGHFSFGNAQKLINIIMKYFYIGSYGDSEKKKNFRFCHCPMDSIMLEKVWKERSDLPEDYVKKLPKREEFLKSWGKEDFSCKYGACKMPERYRLFQTAVSYLADKDDFQGNLEFDYHEWMP